MRYRHCNRTLKRIDEQKSFSGGYPKNLVEVFRRRMGFIRDASNETQFYAAKSLHYEKLKGARKHQRSMRLNSQFRLIVEIESGQSGNVVAVMAIEDYH